MLAAAHFAAALSTLNIPQRDDSGKYEIKLNTQLGAITLIKFTIWRIIT